MSRRQRRMLRIAAPVAGALIALLAGFAQHASAQRGEPEQSSADWLRNCRDRDGDSQAIQCEVRTSTLAAVRELTVDAEPNGGVNVIGWDRAEIRVEARIQARAPTQAEANSLASAIHIETSGARVRADGPESRDRRNWSVSYEVFAPREIDLDLQSVNGGLAVSGVRGDMELNTTNGGISLVGASGDVRARTTNGGLHVELEGRTWNGQGLDLATTNGGIDLAVPDDFSAHLVASTVHGGVDTDFPVTVQGRIGRRIDAVLGNGGPTVNLTTTNGGIRIRRN
jgi:DUF4097 and DUF4098 domain-containing protein YvlB